MPKQNGEHSLFVTSLAMDTPQKMAKKMSTRKMKVALKELIDAEDKSKPMSDDKLTSEMAKRGFPIARRTIAKYREQLGIPVARLRKSINIEKHLILIDKRRISR